MKRIEWNTCINCPWIAEDRNTCKLRYKVIVDIGNIPEWCPLPDSKQTMNLSEIKEKVRESVEGMDIYIISYYNMDNFTYDSYDAHVVVANNEEEVRELAKNSHADEGERIWETAEISKVGHYMGVEVSPFILLSSFNAG